MSAKKPEKPEFTLEVVSATVQVQVIVRNAAGKIADTQTASLTVMNADLEKHSLPSIACAVEKELTAKLSEAK